LLQGLSRVRSDLSFDDEPQISQTSPDGTATPRLRSLRARLDLWLR
jgi:hypothetical protein